MAKINCLFSPTFENPCGFSVWFLIEKLSDKPLNFSKPRNVSNKLNLM